MWRTLVFKMNGYFYISMVSFICKTAREFGAINIVGSMGLA